MNRPTLQNTSPPKPSRTTACTADLVPIKFSNLWANYVTGDPYRDPSTGKVPAGYGDQCALRLSATFHKSGVDMRSFHGASRVLLGGKPAAARASDLADWLNNTPCLGLPPISVNVTGKDWPTKVKGRTGILFFENYWTRPGETQARASGSHIDLWNGSRLTISGFADGVATMGRYLGRDSLFQGTEYGYSDLGGSTRILFWEIR